MRQSEARDLRSFLAEPVEEIIVEGVKVHDVKTQPDNAEVGARGIAPVPPAPFIGEGEYSWDDTNMSSHRTEVQLQEVGAPFISPWDDIEVQLHSTGVRFTTPWEGTGGQLHEVGARFTGPLSTSSLQNDGGGTQFTSPWGTPVLSDPPAPDQSNKDDLMSQQTMPIPRIPELSGVQSGLSPLRPYRLQRYQSRGVPVSLSRSASGTLRLRPAGNQERRATADLAPAPQKIVPGESSPALQSWERRRHTIYVWLVLLTLFLLVVLGGIWLDSLIASYR